MARTTSSVAARAAKRAATSYSRAKYHSSRSETTNTTTIPSSKSFISLQAFISNFFYLIAIQDNDEFFEQTYEETEARRITETGNGETFDRDSFKDFVVELRRTVSDRQLVSQSFLVVPDDARGITGDVAHTLEMSGVQKGKEVVIKVVAVLRIIYDHKRNKRVIDMESFVLETQEVED
ncbi:hypothetical protein GE09DRAFT_1216036 [Coniochaeta sp. 2T2.1]|nr:hypothetical protein GE09DRAFT_1216036 [Coniochaeta sp. 2T2.1]